MTDVGVCDACTSMAVSGIGSTKPYTARLTASSSAGPAPYTSSSPFTGMRSGASATCATDTCTTIDANCSLAACDTTAVTGDPIYSSTYLASDGSSARVAAAGAAAQIVTRASDGTAGAAGDMVLAGNLNLSVTAPNTVQASAAGISTASPTAKTPRGYLLRGNRVDEYHYRSENGMMKVTKRIRGSDFLVGAVKVQMRQTLNGGDSHAWKRGMASWDGGDPYDFYYAYNCGINVPKDDDWTCKTHEADASGTWDDDLVHGCYGSVSDIHGASFGSTETRYAKFPLVAYRTGYRDGGYDVHEYLYYRGWDVRKTGTPWIMPPATGTGH